MFSGDMANLTFVKGHDTTTSALSWALYTFASHPEAQTKIQKEIDDVLDGRDTDEILW